ncbi:bifunctional tetrahydrofolate synthase/dihydrofolate synthase [Alkalimarinus sediminis]|uniref:Dihydrofolate synthase/folylpolyglutamate synthase n=1 Tax=Alkalimarinus sediminis TaxID=1632866 RepID=A0A9E8HKE8_9ALTE|nr:bifunctional tetrahydrofolate synthase/dihydrofolate synthase [Alkalimarinus sediminis]UZW76059.1 bifunctional tetrahydrofolate synthase/dihydrofolate synthase [Alkalimarinus sediminis]
MSNQYQTELDSWLNRIEQNHPSEIEMGLDRTLTVYSKLRKKRLAKRIVVVAGTNGKGSTIAAMERLLLDAGQRVGVYTSPHIKAYNERVRIDGELIDNKRLVDSFNEVEQARGGTPLTYFEFGTLSALCCFQKEDLDVVLLEVGLGGRLDAVNIVDADLSIITSVDIDHIEWLGDNRESIGFEKAGIFRQGVPAIYGEGNPPHSVIQQANAQQINLLTYQQHFGMGAQENNSSNQYDWLYQPQRQHQSQRTTAYIAQPDGESKDISMPFSLLPESNLLTAVQAMQCLGYAVDNEQVHQSLDGFAVDGRFQVYDTDPLVLLDVGHNPHAAKFLASRLAGIKRNRPVYGVFSMLADKDVQGVIEGLGSQITEWHVAPLVCDRAMAISEICEGLTRYNQVYFEHDSLDMAYQKARNAAKQNDGIVMCFGSFHVVSDID